MKKQQNPLDMKYLFEGKQLILIYNSRWTCALKKRLTVDGSNCAELYDMVPNCSTINSIVAHALNRPQGDMHKPLNWAEARYQMRWLNREYFALFCTPPSPHLTPYLLRPAPGSTVTHTRPFNLTPRLVIRGLWSVREHVSVTAFVCMMPLCVC